MAAAEPRQQHAEQPDAEADREKAAFVRGGC